MESSRTSSPWRHFIVSGRRLFCPADSLENCYYERWALLTEIPAICATRKSCGDQPDFSVLNATRLVEHSHTNYRIASASP
ncbi:hypothetical protein JMJ77_0015112 [Colletotrichum scovillei]|uniref:Uncharacterized protein n=1 Tax=Colletotrichum scovillei TaxID=1209932 RepID=A0A9P7R3I9_9PEZI|nr:hypothetical protein JMJ77_0015112 [Colletotrichum scovillei]KAG7056734.1 hypothetical protein JMJ78_0000525 [Colletotrichum scovillei]KAG7066632.1 hypothetical protein JMJ76_0000487 [Colletotrichum scovillei]